MMNLKEYISEKYYILDLFKELVDNLNIDNVDCNELLLSFPMPFESYTGGEVDLVKNAIVNFIKRNSCHYKVDLDLKSQYKDSNITIEASQSEIKQGYIHLKVDGEKTGYYFRHL